MIGGRRGHVGTFNWLTGKLDCELHLKETIRDVCWLQNETMFAVAQKRCANQTGKRSAMKETMKAREDQRI